MLNIVERLERDVRYLQQNLVPIESSGKLVDKLDYEGSSSLTLTNSQVETLADALKHCDKFSGPLNLEQNNLNDLAMLAISDVLRQRSSAITRLNISKNTALTCKTGQYIG